MNYNELRPRVALAIDLAGGYFFERKQLKTSIIDVVVKFARFIDLKFTGCFFGPMSSDLDLAVDSCIDAKYVTPYYHVVTGEPAHKAYELTERGYDLTSSILNSPSALEDLGLNSEDIPKLSANLLSFGTCPTSFNIAYTLLIDRVEPVGLRYRREITEEPFITESFRRIIKRDSFRTLPQIYEKLKWVQLPMVVEDKDTVAFPYWAIDKEIRRRYEYLVPNFDKIEKDLYEVQQVGKAEAEDFLLRNAVKRVRPDLGLKRQQNIRKLISSYPNLPIEYVTTLTRKLELLREKYPKIIEKGYKTLFDEYLLPLAKLTEEFKLRGLSEKTKLTDLEDTPYVAATVTRESTTFYINIPKEMKRKFETLNHHWNDGTTRHIDHFAQIEGNSLMIDRDAKSDILLQRRE